MTILDTPSRPSPGATVDERGAGFRVWAPHADAVGVVGDFNDWVGGTHPLESTDDGQWVGRVDGATAGQEYRFEITNGDDTFLRIDPYAREVTNSVGNAVLVAPASGTRDGDFSPPSLNELVVYEMHVGTFNRLDEDGVGTFDSVGARLDYLAWLGINAIEIMPVAEFAGDISWGYNPAHIFAIESAYGGPEAFKRLVAGAHERGIAVIMDVVYNHFGPSDLAIWQFDGWSENDKGGIYFYNDHRSETPWGDTRPDYGRPEVRDYIRDNARMWVEDYAVDGLRYDMTLYMRSTQGVEDDIEDGWTLAQWVNDGIRAEHPDKILIAEDLRSNAAVTTPKQDGGACFNTQWDEGFVHPVRAALAEMDDANRDVQAVAAAITNRYNHDVFERVVYTESHDEVANGKQRLPSEIDADNPTGWYAERRSGLGALLVFTSPGVPMIFQGQEFLRDRWFDDNRAIDWDVAGEQDNVMRLYRDLIRLRRNVDGHSSGLTGQEVQVIHANDEAKVIAFRRWREDDPAGETLVIVNLAAREWGDYRIGAPGDGAWTCRFDNGSAHYLDPAGTLARPVIEAEQPGQDGLERSLVMTLAPYAGLVYTRG